MCRGGWAGYCKTEQRRADHTEIARRSPRTNEFDIRMALGAQRGHLLRIVISATATSICSPLPPASTGISPAFLVHALCASHIGPTAAPRIDKGDLRKAVSD